MSLFRETGADIISISENVQKIIDDENGVSYPEDLGIIITSDESNEVSDSFKYCFNECIWWFISCYCSFIRIHWFK